MKTGALIVFAAILAGCATPRDPMATAGRYQNCASEISRNPGSSTE